jgi:hypothetical protein
VRAWPGYLAVSCPWRSCDGPIAPSGRDGSANLWLGSGVSRKSDRSDHRFSAIDDLFTRRRDLHPAEISHSAALPLHLVYPRADREFQELLEKIDRGDPVSL